MPGPISADISLKVNVENDFSAGLKQPQTQSAPKELKSALEHISTWAANVTQRTMDAASDRLDLLGPSPEAAAVGLTTTISISEVPSPTTTLVQSPPISVSNSQSSENSQIPTNISSLAESSILGPPESLSRPITPEPKKLGLLKAITHSKMDLVERAKDIETIVAPVINPLVQNFQAPQLLAGALQVMNRFVEVADALKKVMPHPSI